MSNVADIAAHTQRSTAVCLRTHNAVTAPSRKADADERRHCRAAANSALSRPHPRIERHCRRRGRNQHHRAFLTEASAEAIAAAISETIQPPTRGYFDFEPSTNRGRSGHHDRFIIFTIASTFGECRHATRSYTQAQSARCCSSQRLSQRTFV